MQYKCGSDERRELAHLRFPSAAQKRRVVKLPYIIILSYRHLKNLGAFNGIRIRDLCDAGSMLFQLSYEATQLPSYRYDSLVARIEDNKTYDTGADPGFFLGVGESRSSSHGGGGGGEEGDAHLLHPPPRSALAIGVRDVVGSI